jgi:hypothetical protein
MISAGGNRLGEHVDLYRSALAEVQQVYVRATQGVSQASSDSLKSEGETESTE